MIRILGFKGFIFFLISKFLQEKLGKIVDVKPGVDMLFAINLAKNNHLNLFFIDQPIEKTIRRLGKKITFKEKMEFVKDLFKALFFPKKQKKVNIGMLHFYMELRLKESMKQLKIILIGFQMDILLKLIKLQKMNWSKITTGLKH